jgi:hypothetical protein
MFGLFWDLFKIKAFLTKFFLSFRVGELVLADGVIDVLALFQASLLAIRDPFV